MSTAETTATGLPTNITPGVRTVKNNLPARASRPDWLLYSVPASAFIIGIIVFAFICKTQRPRRAHAGQRSYRNGQVDNYISFRHSKDGVLESLNTTQKEMTQSYENVDAAVYSNQEKVTYYVSADQDYLTPDEMKEEEGVGPRAHQDTLPLPHNLSDTDGESYENMEGLYAQPRKCSMHHKHSPAEEEDYINPDDDGKQDLTNTDTESYEMMAGSDSPFKDFSGAHDTTDYISPDDDGQKDLTVDTESYELMADSDCFYGNTEAYDITDDSYEQMNRIPLRKEMDE